MVLRVASFVALVTFGLAAASTAQDPSSRPKPHPGATADFLFGPPKGSVAFTTSWVFARAGSDLFDFVRERLTIDGRGFDAPAFGGELGIVLTPRLEAVAGVDWSQSKTPSEYRAFTDNVGAPIVQTTKLRLVNVTGSVKLALTPRGRPISSLAWIPRGLTPYVGGGGGMVHYDFMQSGDFVDVVDLDVFTDVFHAKGWSPTWHAFGGADLQVYRRMYLQIEGRYSSATGSLQSRDFVGFDPIDLAGFRMTVGISALF
jgi:opacity protein-like surface antigen